VWQPRGRVTGVVVRGDGFAYACTRGLWGAWRCGRCQTAELREPAVGQRCPGCQAEVVATQRGLDLWIALIVIVTLVATWVALAWWR
jgi:hypothetical protein